MNETHGITVDNLLRQFPQVLKDDARLLALAEVIARQLSIRTEEVKLGILYANIDSLPERMLDILAYDFKVDWWDTAYSVEEKRETLKGSWQVHRMMGTKAAVEIAISAIYPETKVQEWFEYDGAPFYFRLRINAAGLRTDTEKHGKVLDRVNYYKNLRSHLDGFIWDYTKEPFINDPDNLIFHRFIQSLAFSNRRNRLPILFDGAADFDGAIPFGQRPASMFGFPRFAASWAIPEIREKLTGAGIAYGGIRFQTEYASELERFKVLFPAFSNRRNMDPALFDGAADFDGKEQFGAVIRSMFGFPTFLQGFGIRENHGTALPAFRQAARFREFTGAEGVRFDGRADYSGGICFDQSAGGVLQFPEFRERFPAFSNRRSFTPALFDGGVDFDGTALFDSTPRAMFSVPKLQVRGKTAKNVCHLGRAKLTVDSMYRFDGTAALDGSRLFNADITEEVLQA